MCDFFIPRSISCAAFQELIGLIDKVKDQKEYKKQNKYKYFKQYFEKGSLELHILILIEKVSGQVLFVQDQSLLLKGYLGHHT